MKYYLIRDGQPFGPVEKSELRNYGVTRDSDVWHEGLPAWVKAGSIPELQDIWTEQPPLAYPTPEDARFGYSETTPPPAYQGQKYVPHTNWLPWAVVATVLGALFSCFGMIFGIVGIVQANNANKYYENGLTAAGDSANNTAKVMTIVGFCVAALGLIYTIVMFATGSFSAMVNMMETL